MSDMHPTARRFIASVRTLRRARDMTQWDVHAALVANGHAMTRSAYSAIEVGQTKRVPIEVAASLADILGGELAAMLAGLCETCDGSPPSGFACRTCGATS